MAVKSFYNIGPSPPQEYWTWVEMCVRGKPTGSRKIVIYKRKKFVSSTESSNSRKILSKLDQVDSRGLYYKNYLRP